MKFYINNAFNRMFNSRTARRELSRNRDLRKICGFDDYNYHFGKSKLVPPPKAYTTLIKHLKEIDPC